MKHTLSVIFIAIFHLILIQIKNWKEKSRILFYFLLLIDK